MSKTRVSIRTKLYSIVTAFVLIVISSLGFSFVAMKSLSSIRALVAGESSWSKAQKDAVSHLSNYAFSGDETEFNFFETSLELILFDKMAREVLLSPEPDMDRVNEYLIKGKFHPDDAKAVGPFVRRFKNISFMKTAIDSWIHADQEVAQLKRLAEQIHQAHRTGSVSAQDRLKMSQQVYEIASRLSIDADAFSEALGMASRTAHKTLAFFGLGLVLALLGIGLLISYFLSIDIFVGISNLNLGTARLLEGDLEHQIPVQGKDELSHLAVSFNSMTMGLRTAIQAREMTQLRLEERARLLSEVQEIANLGNWEYLPNLIPNLISNPVSSLGRIRISKFARNILNIPATDGTSDVDLDSDLVPLESFVLNFAENEKTNLIFNINKAAMSLHQYAAHFTVKSSQGLERYLSIRVYSRPDQKSFKVYGSVQDVTEYHTLQMKLVHSNKMASLGEMASGLAHEINNPLAVIKLAVNQIECQLEKGFTDTTQMKSVLAKVETTTDRIARIVKSFRFFSRDGSQDPYQIIEVQQLIEDTMSFCREKFKHNQVHVQVQVRPSDLLIEGRFVDLGQVILNLIVNSNDAVANLPDKWIRIDAYDTEKTSIIKVTDSGSGISASLRNKIFTPFFTTKEVGKGSGIGLSLSLGIVEEHKGRLYIDESSPNTCFVVELPRLQLIGEDLQAKG